MFDMASQASFWALVFESKIPRRQKIALWAISSHLFERYSLVCILFLAILIIIFFIPNFLLPSHTSCEQGPCKRPASVGSC